MNNVQVLLIDGGEALPLRESARKSLSKQFRMARTSTLSEGLKALRGSAFQLVLLDLSLPDVSATDSVTQILKTVQDLTVIALVNEGQTGKALEAMRLGAEDYVVKECRCDSLLRAMQHAVERKQLIADREDSDRLRASEREELLNHLSHELRNALACIHQFGNILIDGLAGEVSKEQADYLGIMLENASRIRSVMDTLQETVATGPRQ